MARYFFFFPAPAAFSAAFLRSRRRFHFRRIVWRTRRCFDLLFAIFLLLRKGTSPKNAARLVADEPRQPLGRIGERPRRVQVERAAEPAQVVGGQVDPARAAVLSSREASRYWHWADCRCSCAATQRGDERLPHIR